MIKVIGLVKDIVFLKELDVTVSQWISQIKRVTQIDPDSLSVLQEKKFFMRHEINLKLMINI